MKREFSSLKLKLATFNLLLQLLLFWWRRINDLLFLVLRCKDPIRKLTTYVYVLLQSFLNDSEDVIQ